MSADWLYDLEGRLRWRNRSKVFLALIVTFYALRDALPVDETVCLGVELPALLRGFYYEGMEDLQAACPAPLHGLWRFK